MKDTHYLLAILMLVILLFTQWDANRKLQRNCKDLGGGMELCRGKD